MNPDEEEAFKKQKRKEKYDNLVWTEEENLFRTRSKFRHPSLIKQKIPVSLALKVKLKCSCFGRFMKTFNEDQLQSYNMNNNKLGMEEWDLKHFDGTGTKEWEYYHNFSENLFDMLKTAVDIEACIDYTFFYNNLTALRLTDCQITCVDFLKKFENLKILVLAGNWIKQINGRNLPKRLEFLECFANEISDISKLCKRGPEQIKHLGLGRNYLNNNSNCHLLATGCSFTQLHSLDISNNNFTNLTDILNQLSSLPQLTSLALEGNTCYVCKTYKENILKVFPKLIYLDGTEILSNDRKIFDKSDIEADATVGALIFTCYRLIAIPSPPKGKVQHLFHIEIETPLLEEIKLTDKATIVEDFPSVEPEIKAEDNKKSKKKRKDENKKEKNKKEKSSKNKSEKSSKKSKASKFIKGKGLYALPDEYEEETKTMIENNNFRTEERGWAQVIRFNNPAIIVDAPENNLELLRDTFKSRIKVKIVYTQKQVQKKTKKEKKKGKEKNAASINEPKEIILKKSTFATFFCDLHSVNWSDQYIDFLWTDHPKLKNIAIPVNGSLKPEIYAEKKGKGKGSKKEAKSDKKSKSSTKTETSRKLPLPTKLTCHFGFGLSRYGLIQENVPLKKQKSEKKLKKIVRS